MPDMPPPSPAHTPVPNTRQQPPPYLHTRSEIRIEIETVQPDKPHKMSSGTLPHGKEPVTVHCKLPLYPTEKLHGFLRREPLREIPHHAAVGIHPDKLRRVLPPPYTRPKSFGPYHVALHHPTTFPSAETEPMRHFHPPTHRNRQSLHHYLYLARILPVDHEHQHRAHGVGTPVPRLPTVGHYQLVTYLPSSPPRGKRPRPS